MHFFAPANQKSTKKELKVGKYSRQVKARTIKVDLRLLDFPSAVKCEVLRHTESG
jgi:hypothetical protein